jgi:hypothetical protein
MEWVRDLEARGHLKDPGQPLDGSGKVVRGKDAVTDGPHAETKDLVAGFMIIEARDLAQAAELAAGCPMLGHRAVGGHVVRSSSARAARTTVRSSRYGYGIPRIAAQPWLDAARRSVSRQLLISAKATFCSRR